MKKIVIIISLLLLVVVIGYFGYQKYFKIYLNIKNDIIEINTNHELSEYVDVKNGVVVNSSDILNFNEIKEEIVKIKIENRFKKIIEKEIFIKVIDTEKPIIEYDKKITITIGDKVDLLKNVKVKDNSLEDITPVIDGDYDLKKEGTYKLKYIASDSSGNKEEVEFELIVKKAPAKVSSSKYYIKVNKELNVLMVYGLDENNEYNKLVKTFVISAGNNTPLGTYKTDLKYETLKLEGGVYGHYTVRFLKSRGMWFHSVPYFSKPTNGNWDNLEYEEYNKLGTLASLGCIRLAVIDAKWIYDNIPKGTTVEIYESDTLPDGVVKPIPIKIDVNSENRGWDPTDPDIDNPWHN